MEFSNQQGKAELIRTLHPSPNENILNIGRMKTFIICILTRCYIKVVNESFVF